MLTAPNRFAPAGTGTGSGDAVDRNRVDSQIQGFCAPLIDRLFQARQGTVRIVKGKRQECEDDRRNVRPLRKRQSSLVSRCASCGGRFARTRRRGCLDSSVLLERGPRPCERLRGPRPIGRHDEARWRDRNTPGKTGVDIDGAFVLRNRVAGTAGEVEHAADAGADQQRTDPARWPASSRRAHRRTGPGAQGRAHGCV